MIKFRCLECDKKLKADERYAGRLIRCSGCGHAQAVPPAESSPAHLSTPGAGTLALRMASVRQSASPQPPSEPPITLLKQAPEDDGLDMTPMVDVTFLLLIFFMVTAAFALQKSLQMPTPDASEAASQTRTLEELEQDDDYVIVRIDGDNTVWVNDAEAPSEQELLAKLREARQGPPGTSTPGPSKLLVLASGDARHEKVVMALDAGTAAGMEDVRLADGEYEL